MGGKKPGRVAGIGINDMRGWCAWQKLGTDHIRYRIYTLWKSMLQRCYNAKCQESNPCYKGCSVCERWHRLSNFAEDIQNLPGYEMWRDNPRQMIALDKDTRVKGNKVYSLGTCCFLTLAKSVGEANSRHAPEYGDEFIHRGGIKKPKAVVCLFPDGRTIEYPSAGAAARANKGFIRRNIASCCEGKHKTHKGCKFYYA